MLRLYNAMMRLSNLIALLAYKLPGLPHCNACGGLLLDNAELATGKCQSCLTYEYNGQVWNDDENDLPY